MNEIDPDYKNAYYDFSFKIYRDCRTGDIYEKFYGNSIPEINTSCDEWEDGCICSIEYNEREGRYIRLDTGETVGSPRHTLVDHIEHYEWAIESAQLTGNEVSYFLDEEYDYIYKEVLCECGRLEGRDDLNDDDVYEYDNGITICSHCTPDPSFHPDPVRFDPLDYIG